MIGRRQWIGGATTLLGVGIASARARAEDVTRLPALFAQIEAAHGGRLGVAMLDIATGRSAAYRADDRFPMGSTYKLLAAAAVLARADAGQDHMDRRVRIAPEKLVSYSPVTGTRVGGEGMTLGELCAAAVIVSDNTAGNLLLATLGGPAGLTAFCRDLGDGVTRLDRTEPAVNEAAPGDPRDTTSPAAMLTDLQAAAVGAALAPASRAQLVAWLRAGRTGDSRLRARLPTGWQAGDKTGTADHGTSNDVGLLWPPGEATPVLVAAYLTDGPADGALRDAALAAVGAAVAAAVASRGT